MPISASSMATQKLYTGRPLLQTTQQAGHPGSFNTHYRDSISSWDQHMQMTVACTAVQLQVISARRSAQDHLSLSACKLQPPTECALLCFTGSNVSPPPPSPSPASPAQHHKVTQAVCVPCDLATHNVVDGQLHTTHTPQGPQQRYVGHRGVHTKEATGSCRAAVCCPSKALPIEHMGPGTSACEAAACCLLARDYLARCACCHSLDFSRLSSMMHARSQNVCVCVRACVRVCACVRACVCVCVFAEDCRTSLLGGTLNL
jgi:hypothetical protein